MNDRTPIWYQALFQVLWGEGGRVQGGTLRRERKTKTIRPRCRFRLQRIYKLARVTRTKITII